MTFFQSNKVFLQNISNCYEQQIRCSIFMTYRLHPFFHTCTKWKENKLILHTRKGGLQTLERTQESRILRRTLSLTTLMKTLSLGNLRTILARENPVNENLNEYTLSLSTLRRILSLRTLWDNESSKGKFLTEDLVEDLQGDQFS